MESRRLWKDPHARLLVKPKSFTNIDPSLVLLSLTSLVSEFSCVTHCWGYQFCKRAILIGIWDS